MVGSFLTVEAAGVGDNVVPRDGCTLVVRESKTDKSEDNDGATVGLLTEEVSVALESGPIGCTLVATSEPPITIAISTNKRVVAIIFAFFCMVDFLNMVQSSRQLYDISSTPRWFPFVNPVGHKFHP